MFPRSEVSADSLQPSIPVSSSPTTTPGRVARNLLFTAAAQVWAILISLLTVPIVLHGIGAAAYGVFVLAWLVVGYAALLDLGLAAATIRAVAIQRAVGDNDSLQRTVSTAMASLIAISVPGGALLFLGTFIMMRYALRLPPGLENDAIFVFGVVAAAFAVNACLTIFLIVVIAMQRFRLVAIQSILVSTTTAIAQVVMVHTGLGLRWLVLASFAIFALSLVVFIQPARTLLTGIQFRPQWDRQTFRALIRFGGTRFAGQVLLQLAYGVDRIVIAVTLPVTALTYYSIPLSVTQKFVTVQATIGQTFFPSASELHGIERADQLRRLYLDVMKLAVIITLPLAVLVGAFAWPILDAWLGPAFADESAGILSALAFGYGLVALIIVPAQASDATGHVRWTMTFAGFAAAITGLFAIVLVHVMGAVGAAIALSVGIGGIGLVFLWVVQRWMLGLSLDEVLRHSVARPAVAAAGLGVYCWALAPHVRGIPAVLASFLVGAVVYGGFTILTGTWTSRERQFIMRLLTVGRVKQ